ncbi:MAG: hypothetical protein DKT66_15680 [Candidatus Melainabacteria bacterium]|nr:MAG: hypothetical protein DKT66_15680 [Candidatus Melainabacteria bacterium]
MKKIAIATMALAAFSPAFAQNSNSENSLPSPASSLAATNPAGNVQQTKSFELFRQGQNDFIEKNYSQAESKWKKAIELAPSENDSRSKAECMCGLAIVYTKQGRITDAKKASDDAIQFITSSFGADDPRLGLLKRLSQGASNKCVAPSVDESGAEWMKNIEAGTAAMNSGNFSDAVSSFEAALAIVDKTQPDSGVAAATLSPLVAAYLKSGDLKKAEATIDRALPLCKKYFPDKPKLTEALQSELASLKAKQSKP